jgi:hypothetical protein
MKKVMTMLALLTVALTMQAQTKFHDVEANEATGPVKTISQNMMGQDQTVTFTKDGKMQREGMSDAVYDANGYLQSVKMSVMGQEVTVKYKWENGKVAAQTIDMGGREMTMKMKYNEKGVIASQSMDMGGQEMETPYTDYKYDDRGNWISRHVSMMGQDMEQVRKIEYYE